MLFYFLIGDCSMFVSSFVCFLAFIFSCSLIACSSGNTMSRVLISFCFQWKSWHLTSIMILKGGIIFHNN